MKFRPFWLTLIPLCLLVVAFILLFSPNKKAEAANGQLQVTVLDQTPPYHDLAVEGLQINANIVGSGITCSNMVATSNASGLAIFFDCMPGTYHLSYASADYYEAPGSPYKIGQHIQVNSGSTAIPRIYLLRKDTDSDGVYNIDDQCDSQPGPASNQGCPVAAPPANINNPAPTKPAAPKTNKPKATPKQSPAIVNQNNAGDTAAPAKPEKLEVALEKGKMVLSWSTTTDDVGVVGYSVERSTDGLEWEYIAQNIQETSFIDEDTEPNTYYFYRVRAQDEAGNQSEAMMSEAVLSAAVASDTKPDETATTVQKKKSGGAGLVVAGLLAVIAIGGGVWWLRRRSARDAMLYDYETVPQQPQPLSPHNNAAHTGQSLKDMVLEDYHPGDGRGPQTPPRSKS